jgi:uncharacterized protein (DUF488 family)
MTTRKQNETWRGVRIVALGHSTRSFAELVDLLRRHRVDVVADIRSLPGSRRYPQFDREHLAAELPRHGIGYVHLPRLGGRRRSRADSPNTGWRNESFRGYADYMATPEFARGLAELREVARAGTVALLCAEAVPWRCHRSLVADALWARGVVVEQITGRSPARPHRPTPFARFHGTWVTYPPPVQAVPAEFPADPGPP